MWPIEHLEFRVWYIVLERSSLVIIKIPLQYSADCEMDYVEL